MSKIYVVYNTKSGKDDSLDEIKKAFTSCKLRVAKYIPLQQGFEKELENKLHKNVVIVAAGGDGTISAVASVVAGSEASFAVIASGTLNHFAKDTNTPLDLIEAISLLKKLKTKRVDVAEVNDQIFINNSSIGIYSASLEERSRLEKLVGKWPAALWAMLKTAIRFPLYTVSLQTGESKKKSTYRSPLIFIGNNSYNLNGFGLTDRTLLTKGELSVYIAKTSTRLSVLRLLFSIARGALHDSDNFVSLRTSSLTIETHKKKVSVSYDGEFKKIASPLNYKIHKKALRLVVA